MSEHGKFLALPETIQQSIWSIVNHLFSNQPSPETAFLLGNFATAIIEAIREEQKDGER